MCLCACERLCRSRPVRRAATSETVVLEIAGTPSERSSTNWEKEEETAAAAAAADTGETTPWTVWTLWDPDLTASPPTPPLKAAARVRRMYCHLHSQTNRTTYKDTSRAELKNFFYFFPPIKLVFIAFKKTQHCFCLSRFSSKRSAFFSNCICASIFMIQFICLELQIFEQGRYGPPESTCWLPFMKTNAYRPLVVRFWQGIFPVKIHPGSAGDG